MKLCVSGLFTHQASTTAESTWSTEWVNIYDKYVALAALRDFALYKCT